MTHLPVSKVINSKVISKEQPKPIDSIKLPDAAEVGRRADALRAFLLAHYKEKNVSFDDTVYFVDINRQPYIITVATVVVRPYNKNEDWPTAIALQNRLRKELGLAGYDERPLMQKHIWMRGTYGQIIGLKR